MNTEEQAKSLQETGRCCASSLAEMVAALECDYERLQELRDKDSDGECNDEERSELAELDKAAGDCEDREDAEQRIHEDPLEITVRTGWYTPGTSDNDPTQFCILLSTGGPATRIIGDLHSGQPVKARIQVQDWFTPWTDYTGNAITEDQLLTYCQAFYFGD